jgi:aspartyl-tRNA(Asn)/glutamyl-tRNA(Gln) amidotransferase subunit A
MTDAKHMRAGRESELHAVGAGTIGLSDPSFVDFAAAHAQAETLRSAFSGFFRKYDVLLTPVNPMTATPPRCPGGGRQRRDSAMDSRHGGDLAVQPGRTARTVGSLRLQFRKPAIGIQLIAKWLDEVTILCLGEILERCGGLGKRHPLI